jgi:molybdenum cofactor cytidylyltransferase
MSDVAAIILAAGRSTRFAEDRPGTTKLTAELHGKPLVRHVAEAALASRARPVIVVTGHAASAVETALAGLPLTVVYNARYADGLAGSLKAGAAHLAPGAAGAIILLGDMPFVTAELINTLIEHFHQRTDAVVPLLEDGRGNPVLIARALFPALAQLNGDEGARRLLLSPDIRVVEVPSEGESARADIDTREALEERRRRTPEA